MTEQLNSISEFVRLVQEQQARTDCKGFWCEKSNYGTFATVDAVIFKKDGDKPGRFCFTSYNTPDENKAEYNRMIDFLNTK